MTGETSQTEAKSRHREARSGRASFARYIQAAVRRLLPDSTVYELQRYQECNKRERVLYLKIRASNVLGLANSKRERPIRPPRSFLFVCFGNIIRSPMCEALLKQALNRLPAQDITVSSAGLNAVSGRSAHPWAIEAARELGVSLDDHRSRRLSEEMVDQADAIFTMDYQNLAQLLSRYPKARKKSFMMSSYCGTAHSSAEIRDPYGLGEEETHECYRVLSQCIQNLVDNVFSQS
jgi:protein-tyrosine phosphatase